MLDSSEIRERFIFSSYNLADLAMRGFAISFMTLACVISSIVFLVFLLCMQPPRNGHKTMSSLFTQLRKVIRLDTQMTLDSQFAALNLRFFLTGS